LQADGSGALAGTVRVAPLARMDAVLVIAHSAAAIAAAERVQRLLDAQNANTVRSWYVENLQNSRADDVANLLQQAFTPNHITVQPTSSTATPVASVSSMGSTSGIGGSSTTGSSTSITPQNTNPAPAATIASSAGASGAANPVQGGTDSSSDSDQSDDTTQEMRIISNPQNNAVLVYATRTEEDTVEAMLRKIDIVPLQVRIDATIAEVTLNDNLQFGTQFYFKSAGPLTSSSGGINSFLASAFSGSGAVTGFAIAGSGASQVALEALQQVTKVRVLSSPEVMALDGQQATLQVGDQVPILTSSSQSTIANSSVINSIQYQQTGVILQVTPRVNSGGRVTLDLSQDVSDVDSSITTSGINSPSFNQRSVRTRVVVQDGQTVGVAGLIQDSSSVSNQGVPFLKDVPWVGGLFGQQNNTRTRTELIVLITPHVVSDQRSIDALTADLGGAP
jgi:general secretion pathway protein D